MIRYLLTNFFKFPCDHCDTTRQHLQWWWLEVQHWFWSINPFGKKCDDLYYFIKNWISPWNVIKLRGLNRNWHDTDERMFHAIFELVCNYVENECPFGGGDELRHTPDNIEGMRKAIEDWLGPNGECAKEESGYGALFPKGQYDAAIEALELYDWYNNHYELERKRLDDTIMNIYYPSSSSIYRIFGAEVRVIPEDKRITTEQYWKMEEDFDKKCDDQLTKCIKLRKTMWT